MVRCRWTGHLRQRWDGYGDCGADYPYSESLGAAVVGVVDVAPVVNVLSASAFPPTLVVSPVADRTTTSCAAAFLTVEVVYSATSAGEGVGDCVLYNELGMPLDTDPGGARGTLEGEVDECGSFDWWVACAPAPLEKASCTESVPVSFTVTVD